MNKVKIVSDLYYKNLNNNFTYIAQNCYTL